MTRETVRNLVNRGALLVEDGNHGECRPRPDEFISSGIPFIRAADMSNGVVDFVGSGKINAVARARIRKGIGAPGDVILSHKGTVGRVAVAPIDSPDFVCSPQTTFWRSLNPDVIDQRYLRYAMRSRDFVRQLDMLKGQTDMAPYVSLTDQRSIELELPGVEDQRAIGEILGALDDKIVANDQLSRTTDDLLAALFTRLRIGAKWGTLKEIATINAAVARPVGGGHLRYLDISSVSVGHYDFPSITSWDNAPGRARRVLKSGDTVWSTVRPNRRSHALVLDDDANLIASTGLAVLSPNKGRIACVYESTRTEEFVQYLEGVAEGSAYPAVRVDRFNDTPVPALSSDKLDWFELKALPLRKRAHAAVQETRSLAMVRDELLPLLMPGKIRVRDAEKVIGEVL